MKNAYDTLLRLQRWQLDEERRKLAALYREQERLTMTSAMLEQRRAREAQLEAGEVAYAYPGYAHRVRADQASLAGKVAEIDEAVVSKQDDVATAYLAMKQVEIVRDKQRTDAARVTARREQQRLDEMGLNIHRRRAAVGTTRA